MIKTITAASFIFCLALLASGQTNNTLSVRIDPDDWNQFTYTRAINEKDSVVFHYWVKRNKDQFTRVNWQRTEKISKRWSLTYGAGGQILKNRSLTDPQLFATVVAKVTLNSKVTASAPLNFNISFRLPLLVKTIPVIQVKANKDLTLGYRGEVIRSSKGKWLENRHGGTADYALTNKVTAGIWVYRNEKTNRFGATYALTVKF